MVLCPTQWNRDRRVQGPRDAHSQNNGGNSHVWAEFQFCVWVLYCPSHRKLSHLQIWPPVRSLHRYLKRTKSVYLDGKRAITKLLKMYHTYITLTFSSKIWFKWFFFLKVLKYLYNTVALSYCISGRKNRRQTAYYILNHKMLQGSSNIVCIIIKYLKIRWYNFSLRVQWTVRQIMNGFHILHKLLGLTNYFRNWKRPKCPSLGELLNLLWYICTMDYPAKQWPVTDSWNHGWISETLLSKRSQTRECTPCNSIHIKL